MCGRYSLTVNPHEVAARFECAAPVDAPPVPRFNIAPGAPAWTVRADSRGRREMGPLRWGLLPHWAPDALERGFINARAETAADKPGFRGLVDTRRCLVPADGFYEWPRHARPGVAPIRFVRPDRAPFAMAGLWRRYEPDTPGGGTAGVVDTFTILTTRPAAPVAAIHDRMPVILRPELEAVWLDGHIPWRGLPAGWMDPPAAAEMEGYPVGRCVNRADLDHPECIRPAPDPGPDLFARSARGKRGNRDPQSVIRDRLSVKDDGSPITDHTSLA
jgi:putative SOS response-associated peptidase YedK